jgi:hypothetical protein
VNTIRFQVWILLAAFISIAGCVPRLASNPLEGWKGLGSAFVIKCPFGESVVEDYQSYIQTLSTKEKLYVHNHDIRFFETADGRRAVEIAIPIDGKWWKHVLEYGKDNSRIKVIKYTSSRYRS